MSRQDYIWRTKKRKVFVFEHYSVAGTFAAAACDVAFVGLSCEPLVGSEIDSLQPIQR